MSTKRSKTNYYHKIKKARILARKQDSSTGSDSESDINEVPIPRDNFINNSGSALPHCPNISVESVEFLTRNDLHNSSTSSSTSHDQGWNEPTYNNVDNLIANEEQNKFPEENMYTKVRSWAIKNIRNIPLNAITELLEILKSEGYSHFPSSAQCFLEYQHKVTTTPVQTKRSSKGQYVYLGIKNGLEKRILPEIYKEEHINILVHIDGMNIYKTSKSQLWPILVKVYHKDYICSPFMVAAFYGDAKPDDPNDLLNDFVLEAKELVRDGVKLHGKIFSFQIMALIADGQARSYLKCTKGPTGYYSCERCKIKGITVNRRRVFPKINCKERNKSSFAAKKHKKHHQPDMTTPLIDIPNFDPVKDVVLDSMHLLFLGAMKNLLEKWMVQGSLYRLRQEDREKFRNLMESISQFIPVEFQRKKFDVEDVSHWKATQFRFFLIYCGPIILQFMLPTKNYKHFLLLHASCRLLCHPELAIHNADTAKEKLREFFRLIPTFYGNDSQVMNFHYLIHIADDVKHLRSSLNEFSAFWGESYIGKLKHLVHSSAKPLPQIINRINAVELSDMKVKKFCSLGKFVFGSTPQRLTFEDHDMIPIHSFEFNDMFYNNSTPNNIVELNTGKIIIIRNIFMKKHNSANAIRIDDVLIEGVECLEKENVFENPCASMDIGIVKIKSFSRTTKIYKGNDIKTKCMLATIENKEYSIALLHSETR